LETIHEHAAQLLEQHSETALVRDRHADSFVRLAEVAGPQLRGSTQVAWSRRLSTELGNLQAALGWLREQADAARGLRLLGYLGEFWCDRYGNSEGLAQLRWFLELPAGNPATADRARTLGVAGWQAIFHGDDAASIQFSEQAWALWQQLDDQTYLPFLCVSLGMAYTGVGVEARAARYSEEAVRLGRALSDTRSVARALNNLGVTARDRGEHALATALVDEALTVARGADDEDSMALTLLNLGYQTLTHDDVGRAGDFLRQSLRLYQALGQPWGVVSCVEILALIAQQHGLAAHAVQLLSAAQALHTRLNIADQGAFGAERAAAVHTLRASLGDDAYAVAWSRGQAMTPEEFIAEIHAYAESSREYGAAAVERSAPAHAHGLSPRELDVLRLVVDGRSNQEIATALYISPSTVANHLASIMNKLGLESRTAVATWAVRQGVV
jgi:DNA-binding CsgD family transcriptional regulator